MITEFGKNSSAVAISAILLFSSTPGITNYGQNISYPTSFQTKAENTVPSMIRRYKGMDIQPNTSITVLTDDKQENKQSLLLDEAFQLFPDSRALTKEEAQAYDKILDKFFSSPTGRNFFDYYD